MFLFTIRRDSYSITFIFYQVFKKTCHHSVGFFSLLFPYKLLKLYPKQKILFVWPFLFYQQLWEIYFIFFWLQWVFVVIWEFFSMLLQESLSKIMYIFILFIKVNVYASEITLLIMYHVRSIRSLLLWNTCLIRQRCVIFVHATCINYVQMCYACVN